VTSKDGLGRVVAFDPGSVRIGVAASDSGRSLAFPRPPVAAGHGEAERCAAVARDEGARTVVVGHPLSLDGTEGTAAQLACELAATLTELLSPDGIEVVLHDERLTTVTASKRLRDGGVDTRGARGRVDSAAAVVLLEAWMAA
jgi:putative Holliday junction resolvase